jgi:uncharacterized protein
MSTFAFRRQLVEEVLQGLFRTKKLLHIITGPRQVGKTTAALQIAEEWEGAVINASADQPLPPGPEWIRAQWDRASREATQRKKSGDPDVLLILDEVQKVFGWSEVVKELWDTEYRLNQGIQVMLLGSSALLIQKGLTESLSGRFFLYRCSHWGFEEMAKAFSWDLDTWLFFGGYPGAASFINEEEIWRQYVMDSLIETVLSKDVLQLQTVNKPALLRHLFLLAAVHPAQILSYNKMLGQLQNAGNTTTLANYLRLLESAYLISGLELYKQNRKTKRGSSPKLIIRNNALINALTGDSFEKSRDDYAWWGRLIENAVGSHLLTHFQDLPTSIYYWRERDREVDYVIKTPQKTLALEVKSGRSDNPKGLSAFCRSFPNASPVIIGPQGIDFGEFFRNDPKDLL